MHTLPKLPYAYDALEPIIDKQTMEIHHTKHHQGYVNKLNKALEEFPKFQEKSLEELLKTIQKSDIDTQKKQAIINNAGGHHNHSLFWKLMDPKTNTNEELKKEIEKTFGSVDTFKDKFNAQALSRFGSGWSWLVRDENDTLKVYSTANQDSPLLQGHTPILGLDVWEHAYYLKYQNKRAEYVENWWKLVKLI